MVEEAAVEKTVLVEAVAVCAATAIVEAIRADTKQVENQSVRSIRSHSIETEMGDRAV